MVVAAIAGAIPGAVLSALSHIGDRARGAWSVSCSDTLSYTIHGGQTPFCFECIVSLARSMESVKAAERDVGED